MVPKLSIKYFLWSAFLVVFLLLGGCQSLPKGQAKREQAKLSNLQHWLVKARVAIKSEQENVSATLDWQKSGKNFDFHIYGLFGATYAHLIQNDNNATLKLPENQIFYHQDAEQLIYQSMGWDFPIDALSYWIKGLPSGKSGEKILRHKNGQLKSILFQNWQVEFSRFENYSGHSMPKIIKASHPQMSIKIVTKKWSFGPV